MSAYSQFLNEICDEPLLTPLKALTFKPQSGLVISNFASAQLNHTLASTYLECNWHTASAEILNEALTKAINKIPSKKITNNFAPNALSQLGAPFDILVAPLILHWQHEPLSCLSTWRSLLKTHGIILFSVFGTGSFVEYINHLQTPKIQALLPTIIDLHHWGDTLLKGGFSDPVITNETIRLEYSQPWKAWREARHIAGQPQLPLNLPPPKTLKMQLRQQKGWCCNTIELVCAHAFVPATTPEGAIPIYPHNV